MKGKDKIFQQWYQDYASSMLGLCLRYTSTREEAEDVMQEGFLRVYKSIDNFQEKSNVKTWITRIMINTAISHYRNNNLLELNYQDEFEQYNENINNNIPSSVATNELLEVINLLPNDMRLIFNMSAIEGYSHREIAEILGISRGTSKIRLLRARQKIQEVLKEKGYFINE